MPVRHAYFVIGDIGAPNGGAHVIFDIVNRLNAAGIAASLLHTRPDFHYSYADMPEAGGWSPRLARLRRSRAQIFLENWRRSGWTSLQAHGGRARWQLAEPGPDDIIVAPEFRYPEIAEAFPAHRIVVLVQGNYSLLNAFERDWKAGSKAFERVSAFLATSEACKALAALFEPPFLGDLRLDLDGAIYRFTEQKRFQIAYMARRRHDEVLIFEALAQKFLPDVPLVRIDGVSRVEAARMIGESLFFVSFSEKEGFGLPAAEALSTGALVTGYTGVGGEEFFTSETGFPVPDSDIVALIDELRGLVEAYRQNPTDLDRKRREASKFVQEKYNKEVATSQLIATWRALEKYLE